MQSSDNGYIIEFYTTGSSESISIEVQSVPGFEAFTSEEFVCYIERKGYTVDRKKPFYVYDIVSKNIEINKEDKEYKLMGEGAILNPFYGSNAMH